MNISKILERKKILQKELAIKIGVSANTVNTWVKQEKGIKAEQIPEIAKALRVPISALFGDEWGSTSKAEEPLGLYGKNNEWLESFIQSKDDLIDTVKAQVAYFKSKYEDLLDKMPGISG